MGVTIDNLQIDIQSSSTNAAQGIDALATSLEKLKKNGSFKTVSTNLNNLSQALKGLQNVHQASNALRTLANSIEKLKGVGTVASLSNSLKKLPEALKSISNVDLDKVAPQLQKVAEAVAPLSAIKAGGLGTMVNAMKNLGKVTESLDDETITKFAEKVALLNEKLKPLSEKMTTIKAGFNAINSNARKAAGGVKAFDDKVDAATFNLANFVTSVQGVISVLQPLVQIFTGAIDQASEWDGIKYQFGNAFGDQADEYYNKITRITEALSINKQAFMENSAMATSMLVGFGVDKTDAREMGVGYTELAYDIWAAFNNVYKTLDGADGAMAAVRSAISGEVEPIRRAGFTIVDSQLAITAANHGLAYSTTEATEAQKSYLRYLTLVDQAQKKGIVGTYAREMETAEGMMRTFSQQVKSLSQAFGSLFLPILVKVMPYLQAFVELLTEAVHWVANLFGVEIQDIGDTWNDYSAGVSDAVENTEGVTGALDEATKAAKALKNATIGIDELNVISSTSASGAGGAGGSGSGSGSGGGFGGLDVDSLWDESIFDSVQSKVDDIKEKLRGMFDDWLPTLQVIGGALGAWSIAKLLDQFGEAVELGDKFHGVVTNIKKLASSAIIIVIQFKLMEKAFGDFMGEDGTILDYIEGVLIGAASTFLLYKMWGKGGLAIGLGVTAVVSLKTVIEEGGITDMESATVALTGLATGIGALAISMKELGKAWEAIKASKFIGELGAFIALAKEHGIVGTFAAAFPKLSSAISSIGTAIGGLSAGTVATIGAVVIAIASYVYFLVENWEELVQAAKDFFGENIAPKLQEIGKHFEKIKEALGPLWDKVLSPMFEGIKDFFANIDITAIIGGIGTAFEWIGGIIAALVSGPVAGLINMVASLLEGAIQFASGIIQTVRGLFDIIVGIFTLDGEKIAEGWRRIWSGIVDVVKGAYDMTIGVVVEFVEGIIDWFVELWDVLVGHSIVPDTIDAIVEWFTSLPSKIFDSVTSFVKGIVDRFKNLGSGLSEKFSSAWNTVKSWWSKKVDLKSYTPSIGSIYDKLKDRWDNARSWWNEKKSKLKEYTPSIGSIYEKVYDRWKSARDWWNNKKASMKTYTPSIGSIVDKVKSAWNTAKNWWNKNVKLSTKLDIKVPKIKVKWDTASAFGKSFKYPTGFKLEFAKDGGIFDQGSLIWAGERGPEVMATAAGGKTGVMNVQQMQEAVYEGVYAAVSVAMRGVNGGGGTQAVNVFLDGKQITSAVEKHQHERGASIMGNEVYSY